MLSLQKQPVCRAVLGTGRSKFIKKAVRLPNGSWALVVFELQEINGKIVAKAVCGKLIPCSEQNRGEENIVTQDEVLALPVYFEKETFKPIVSPFFADIINVVKDLSFVVAQPTRAPNF